MNKKFSTLLAGALLAMSAGNLSAAENYAPYKAAFADATVIQNGKFYQIKVDGTSNGEVLAMAVDADGKYTLSVAKNDGTTDVKNTLWSIESKDNGTFGYSYVLKNIGLNQYLAIDTKNAEPAEDKKDPSNPTSSESAVVGSEVILWTWVKAPNPVGQSFDATGLTAVFGAKNDSVVALTLNGTTVNAIKYAVNNQKSITSTLKLMPVKPGAFVLTADDLNSMMWKQTTDGKMKLSFTPDVNENEYPNVFSQELKAVDIVGYPFRNYYWNIENYSGWNDAEWENKVADNFTYTALYTYDFYQAAEAFVKAISNAISKDTDGATVYNLLMQNFGWTDTPADGDLVTSYNAKMAVAEAIDTKTNEKEDALKVAVKKAMIDYLKAAKFAFVNHFTQPEYAGLPVWGDAQSVVGGIAGKVQSSTAANGKKALTDYIATFKLDEKKTAVDNERKSYKNRINAQGWVSLQTNKGKYVMVDTTYMTAKSGERYLKIIDNADFKDLKANSKGESLSAANWTRFDMNGRFNFQFVYYPYQDSIVIRSAGYAKFEDDDNAADKTKAARFFKDLTLSGEDFVPKPTDKGKNAPAEHNLIKLQVLGNDDHRELTIGNSEFDQFMDPDRTINTRISLNAESYLVKTTLPEGVYFFNLVSNLPARKVENGKYVVADFCGNDSKYATEETFQNADKVQNFLHMPRTQWVVEQNPGAIAEERTVNIYNREFGDAATWQMKNVQLYKDEKGNVFAYYTNNNAPVLALNDTLSAQKIDDAPLKDKYLGYKVLDAEKLMKQYFEMSYLHGTGVYKVQVSESAKDTVVYADLKAENGVRLQLEAIENEGEAKFGYQAGDAAKHLYRQAYRIRVYDSSKLSNDSKYIAEDEANEKSYVITSDITKASKFYLKENNETNEDGVSTCYYALIEKDAHDGVAHRVGVRDASLKFSIENKCAETRVATFSLEEDKTPLYRRLNVTNPNDGLADMDTVWAKIYDVDTHEYLYEDANSVYSKGKYINFLGIENKNVTATNPSLYIDTAYVRNDTRMPQYLIAVDVTTYAEGKHCPYDPSHNTEEYLAAHPEGCPHAVPTKGYKVGRYLVNSADSVALDLANGVNINDSKYSAGQQYTRLHFVWAKHIEDTLVIMRKGPKYDLAEYAVAADSIMLGDNLHNGEFDKAEANWATKQDTLNGSHKNGTKNAVFAFRLVDDAPEADFLIESEGDKAIPSFGKGGWVKNHNGIPVVAKYDNYHSAIQDALIFNIEKSTETPTANEGIAASEVSVIAGNGKIIIKGAAGKKVAISNILGQTIANTVVTSDEATIAAPAGVVVVAVEGEAAVKAIVK